MDTIALWEQEIEENNISHFFEEKTNIINFLYESVSTDIKLIDEGIILENNDDNKASSAIKNKIIMFFANILSVLAKLAAKVAAFVKKVINNVKFKMLEKKLEKAIKSVDIRDKESEIKEKVSNIIKTYKFIDPKYIKSDFSDFQSDVGDMIKDIRDAREEDGIDISKTFKNALDMAADIMQIDSKSFSDIHVSVKNLEELTNLKNNTSDAIKRLESNIGEGKIILEEMQKGINQDKVSNKNLKMEMKIAKSYINVLQKLVRVLIQQSTKLHKMELQVIRLYARYDEDDIFDDDDFEDDDDIFDDDDF